MIRKLAYVLVVNPKKYEQFKRICDRCVILTSDCGIDATMELYNGNVCRFVITGTRCQMTVCYNTQTFDTIRKPRGGKPWFTSHHVHMNGDDVLALSETIR